METLGIDQRHLACTALVVVLLGWAYTTLKSPLAKLPGPWYTEWTDVVLKYKELTGTVSPYVHALHRKYGPIVRTSPDQASVSDTSAMRQMYKINGEFLKAKFYKSFPTLNVFSTTDVDQHRHYRRLLSSGISESGLVTHRTAVENKVRLAIQRMEEESKRRGAADVYNWWLCMTTDIIGELSFGESFGMLETGETNQYIRDLHSLGSVAAIRAVVPGFIVKAAASLPIPIPSVRKVLLIATRMLQYADESLQRHYRIVESEGEAAKPTLFSKLYKAGDDGLPFKDVRDNAVVYIIAGSDTTSNTLTYIVWLVLKHPEVKARLMDELRTLSDGLDYDQVKALPYLSQVIEETLRLYAAIPFGLPRYVPEGGATLAGRYIPGGMTVSAQAYSMHRNPSVFPEPLKFDPSRWEKPTQEMKDSFVPFGGGSRICIGLHLARMELRLGIAHFFTTFPNAKISSKEGFGDKDMDPALFLLLSPKNHRCLIEVS